MAQEDIFYLHLLQQSQSPDLSQRLAALEEFQHDYLDLVLAQFLLDRLNSTGHWQEQRAITELMCLIKQPLPAQALMTILADRETSLYLRMEVAHTLAVVQAEEAIDLVLRVIADPDEEIALREVLTGDLELWGERIPSELLLTLLADRQLCGAALDVWRSQPAESIPLEQVLPYCTHEDAYLRRAPIKTLLAAEQRAPLEPILLALSDPERDVRTSASFGCIHLLELFGDQLPLEPLFQALSDEYPPVRENILDALGKVPLRIPIEPIAAALRDSMFYVRCAALETLGLMGERVPSSLYPSLRELSGSDPSPQVRMRATRALLLLHGMQPAPLKIPIIDLTLEDLGE